MHIIYNSSFHGLDPLFRANNIRNSKGLSFSVILVLICHCKTISSQLLSQQFGEHSVRLARLPCPVHVCIGLQMCYVYCLKNVYSCFFWIEVISFSVMSMFPESVPDPHSVQYKMQIHCSAPVIPWNHLRMFTFISYCTERKRAPANQSWATQNAFHLSNRLPYFIALNPEDTYLKSIELWDQCWVNKSSTAHMLSIVQHIWHELERVGLSPLQIQKSF